MKTRSFVIAKIFLVMFLLTLSTQNTNARPLDVVGSLDISSGLYSKIIVSDDYAYLATGYYFYIIDISDKANPTLAGKYIPRDGSIHDVAIEGDYAYLTAWEDGVHVVDISDPENPYAVGYYDDTPYEYHGVKVDDEKAYFSTSNGLVILDITDPTDPQLEEKYDDGYVADSYFDISLSDGLIFMGYEGLQTLAQSDPVESEILGEYELESYGNYTRILNKNGYVYALRFSGFDIFYMDTTDDTNDPVLVYSEESESSTYDLYLDGNNLYLAEWESGIKIFDVSDPSAPVLKNTSTDSGLVTPVALTVSGLHAYVLSEGAFYVLQKRRLSIISPTLREILGTRISE